MELTSRQRRSTVAGGHSSAAGTNDDQNPECAALLLSSNAGVGNGAGVTAYGSKPTTPGNKFEQEVSLGITLVSISVLFIACQSVKIIPDLYEMTTCRATATGSSLQCPSTQVIETMIR